jgi:hypothetical protein
MQAMSKPVVASSRGGSVHRCTELYFGFGLRFKLTELHPQRSVSMANY